MFQREDENKLGRYNAKVQARYDRRHLLGRAAVRPAVPVSGSGPVKKIHVHPLRCDGCMKIFTDWELRYHGGCPVCGGNRVRGGHPNWWDRLKIFWWALTNNWRVVGWNTQEEKARIKVSR